MTLDEALALFAQPKQRRGRAAAAPLRELGADPTTGQPIVLREGRFGPYVTDGTTNASLRKGDTVEAITSSGRPSCWPTAGPPGRRRAKKKAAGAKKAPAKKAAGQEGGRCEEGAGQEGVRRQEVGRRVEEGGGEEDLRRNGDAPRRPVLTWPPEAGSSRWRASTAAESRPRPVRWRRRSGPG